MNIFDSIIKETSEILSAYTPEKLTVISEPSWVLCEKNELILTKDTAFELGGSRLESVSFSSVSSSKDLVGEDQIWLYGRDLQDIKEDVPFARIVEINIEGIDDENAYKEIKDLEYVKYQTIPKGYMIRSSSFDKREQVRVSKEAVDQGINFESIGSIYIKKLKEKNLVNSVRVIFITEDLPEYKKLVELANRTDSIAKTLDYVMNDIDMNCKACDLKKICDEVEGLKELHFKKSKR